MMQWCSSFHVHLNERFWAEEVFFKLSASEAQLFSRSLWTHVSTSLLHPFPIDFTYQYYTQCIQVYVLHCEIFHLSIFYAPNRCEFSHAPTLIFFIFVEADFSRCDFSICAVRIYLRHAYQDLQRTEKRKYLLYILAPKREGDENGFIIIIMKSCRTTLVVNIMFTYSSRRRPEKWRRGWPIFTRDGKQKIPLEITFLFLFTCVCCQR